MTSGFPVSTNIAARMGASLAACCERARPYPTCEDPVAAPRSVRGVLDKGPQQATTVVTCMDVRIDPLAALGLVRADAHVLRNAGAGVTDDVVRSLIVWQRLLGTRRIVVMGH